MSDLTYSICNLFDYNNMITKNIILPLAAVCLLAGTQELSAQSSHKTKEPVVSVVVGDKNKNEDVQEEFQHNQPKNINDASLPRFAIVGNDGKFYLGIGAELNARAVFDWGGTMPSSYGFYPSQIERPAPGDGAAMRFDAHSSAIYLNFVALPGQKNKIGLYFKGDFEGDDYGFKIHALYATYRGLTAGYTASAFSDGAAMPYTVDTQGPNGSAVYEGIVAYWEQQFTPAFSGAIGLDEPSASLDVNDHTRQVSQRIPAVPLYLQYAWAEGEGHMRLSGLIRPLQYINLMLAKNKTMTGWGLQLSGLTPVLPGLTVYYDATFGRGISSYLQDDYEGNLDASSCIDWSMRLIGSLGLTAGFSYEFSDKVCINANYSRVSNYADDEAPLSGDSYRYGDYVAANLVYRINRIVQVAMEYDYGKRKSFDGTSLHVNRMQAQLAVTF